MSVVADIAHVERSLVKGLDKKAVLTALRHHRRTATSNGYADLATNMIRAIDSGAFDG